MGRSASRWRAAWWRALCSMLLAYGGLAACGPEQADGALLPSAAVATAAPGAPTDRAECRRWTTCVPENPCHTGWVTGCRANVPICTDIGGWLSNGTTCGSDSVCFMGECRPCAAGESCVFARDMYGNPDTCRPGAIACGTGQPVCEYQGPAPDGTACGGGGPFVCKGEQCTWCDDGVTGCFLPESPCHQAVMTACATTGGTCMDTGNFLQNGSWCGDGRVCNGGECVACTWGAPCTPDDLPCYEGYTDCSSGAPRCVPTWPKPDGADCPGGTCRGGTCAAPCVPDQPCTPYNACYSGRTVCDPMYGSWCQEVAPLQDGSSCGDSAVCVSGSCTYCGPTSWCQTPDPCFGSGTISCATGRCEPSPPPFPDGSSCGVGGESCQGGVCTGVPGAPLVVRSMYGWADLTGTTWSRCSADPAAGTSRRTTDTYQAGSITHVEEAFLASPDCTGPSDPASGLSVTAAVTSAGDRFVTWAGGLPPPGAPWSVTATAVHVTGVDPVLGQLDLKFLIWVNDSLVPRQLFQGETDHSLAADGYPTLLVAETHPLQEAMACNAGEPCSPGYPTCERFAIDCAGGAPACVGTGTLLNDGDSCWDGHVCAGGACVPVPSRSVTGTALVTYWTDTGLVGPVMPASPPPIAALSFTSPTSVVTRYPEYHGDGSFTIRDVPEGEYLLEHWNPVRSYVATSSSTLDLGSDLLGRPDVAFATAPTPVDFDVKGGAPWSRGDVLEIASSNASVAAFPFGLPEASTQTVGATQLTGTLEWSGRTLIDGSLGDVAYVFQGSTTTDAATGARVTAASGWAELPAGFVLADGVPATVDVTLAPCPGAGAIAADWRRSEFEAYAVQVHPDAALGNHRLVVAARPHASPFAPPFRSGNVAQFPGLPLLIVQANAGSGDAFMGGIGYGQFLPALWREYRHDRLQTLVSFTAPGAVQPARINAPIGYDVAADAAPFVVAPVVTPPRELRIGGLDAWSGISGVGTMPEVSWTAPERPIGASPHYTVNLYELTLAPDGVGTRLVWHFAGRTTATSFRLPGTAMVPGGRYFVTVTASLVAESLDAPLRRTVEEAFATVVSREFTP